MHIIKAGVKALKIYSAMMNNISVEQNGFKVLVARQRDDELQLAG